jgi:hypothetical protein
MRDEQFYDRPPVQPYRIRSKYTTYLTVMNKFGMLLVGMVIVSMLIGLPSVFSILSLSSSRLHHIETYIETTDANAVVTFTQDIAYELEESVKSYEMLVRLIVGAFVIVLVIFTMNLHWSRMLRELLLFGDIRKKEQSSCTEECNDRGL